MLGKKVSNPPPPVDRIKPPPPPVPPPSQRPIAELIDEAAAARSAAVPLEVPVQVCPVTDVVCTRGCRGYCIKELPDNVAAAAAMLRGTIKGLEDAQPLNPALPNLRIIFELLVERKP